MNSASKYTDFVTAGSANWCPAQIPSWRGGVFDDWRHVRSTAAFNFQSEKAMHGTSDLLVGDCVSISRASSRLLEDRSSIYQAFGANELAHVSGVGAYVGSGFSNKIRNPRGEGGVVGTIGVMNKCTCFNASPPALVTMGSAAAFNSAVTNMIASGGDANTLYGVVDDIAALEALAVSDPSIRAGLSNGWLNGRVYKLDNSAGAVSAQFIPSGQVGSTDQHQVYGYVRGSGAAAVRLEFLPVASTAIT